MYISQTQNQTIPYKLTTLSYRHIRQCIIDFTLNKTYSYFLINLIFHLPMNLCTLSNSFVGKRLISAKRLGLEVRIPMKEKNVSHNLRDTIIIF